jgi:membrane protease YdiL (CAAX protease family)
MSFFTRGCYKVSQARASKIDTHNYAFGILLSALLFSLGHLAVALKLTDNPNMFVYLYIIIGNGIFGCIAGYFGSVGVNARHCHIWLRI